MQVNLDRRNGTDRRCLDRSLFAIEEQASRWSGATPATMAVNAEESEVNYDPYWEPVKGQDDD